MATQLTAEVMQSVFTGFNTYFNKGLAQADTAYQAWAHEVNSVNAVEEFPVLGFDSSLRKWVGDRVFASLKAAKLSVKNEAYANGISVPRANIEDDNISFFSPMFTQMGIAAANLFGDLAIKALLNPGKWADGDDFFKSSRKFEKALINNVYAGALSATAFEAARAQMGGFTDAGGNALHLIPDLLIVGPSLESTAKRILEADIVSDGTVAVSNVNKGAAKVLVNTELVGDYAGTWFLVCANRGLKPVVVTKRKVGTLVRQDREESNCVFERDENRYGISCRGAAAAAYPWLVIRGKAS